MKKAVFVLTCILFGLAAFPITGELLGCCIGYSFELNRISVYAGTLALLSVLTTVLSVISKDSIQNNFTSTLLILMLPLSLVNIILFTFSSGTMWVYVSVTVTAGCAFFMVIWNGKYCASKIIALVLTAILLVPISLFGIFGVLLDDFGHVSVVKTVQSPNGQYRADVVDVDEGARGGSTLVEVYDNSRHFDLLIVTFSKKPQRAYFGEWGAFENMSIRWKNDRCLIINGKECEIE